MPAEDGAACNEEGVTCAVRPLVRGCLTFTAERDSGTYGPDDSRTFAIRCHLGVIAVR